MQIKNVLISVSNKQGLEELALSLKSFGATLYSTGGTSQALRDKNIPVVDLFELTGQVEILDGRVKTLHTKIHAAILADMNNLAHKKELQALGIPKFDLVVINFYPFIEKVATATGIDDIVESIDIGGPAMVRAAAKNYASTAVLTNHNDYPLFIGEIKKSEGKTSIDHRRMLAMKAFISVADLDTAIANYFSECIGGGDFQDHRFFHIEKKLDLVYGENPHQKAACYHLAQGNGGFVQLQGAPVSYNNFLDMISANWAVWQFEHPSVVIVKHNNPCGVASASKLRDALQGAIRTDHVSAFGGVVSFNRIVDEKTALLLQNSFWEVVVAPQFSEEAKSILALKNRLRLLLSTTKGEVTNQIMASDEWFLLQEGDQVKQDVIDAAMVVTEKKPTDGECCDLKFAWRVAAAVKSNAIVIAKNEMAIGIGAGQMSRLDSAWLACEKAKSANLNIKGSVAASDGFFPFPDALKVLSKAGVTSIIQPGGSKNDDKVIAAANEAGIVMLMTGRRHFRH